MATGSVRLTEPWRGLLLAAAFILAGTAILHALSYPRVSQALSDSPLADTWATPLDGLWLMFTVNLGIVAIFLTVVAVRRQMASDSGLLVCAVILAANTALLGAFMGMFAGTLLVGVAAALVIIARVMRMVALARGADRAAG
jgi:hypothetical protein